MEAWRGPVRECAPGVLETEFLFSAGCPVFSGHFPGKPILPGVAQITAAACTAGRGELLPVRRIERCKFLRPVLPGETIRVRAEVKAEVGARAGTDACKDGGRREGLRVNVRLFVGEENCASMTLVLAETGQS
jgi:3-hydroxymyristoyl/3-hydroxydecanoyl-(acyl carrier protein) dehydratase